MTQDPDNRDLRTLQIAGHIVKVPTAAAYASDFVTPADFDYGNEPVRLDEIRLVEVADITNPAAEMAAYAGVSAGALMVVYEEIADKNLTTLYTYDVSVSGGANSPFVVAGSSGFWLAIGGRYICNDLAICGTLTIFGGQGEDSCISITADQGDDNSDLWRICAKEGETGFNIESFATGAWVEIFSIDDTDVTLANDLDVTTDLRVGNDITATAGDISASAGDVVANVDITATTGNIAASAGNVTANVDVTATTGDVEATAGDLIAPTDNKGLIVGGGSDASVYYDGTDMIVKADKVTPSDLVIITGSQKTIELNTPVWEDLRVPAQNTRTTPTKSEPEFENFADGLYAWAFDTSNADDESLHFSAQIPHAYKQGTDIEAHIHWLPSNTDTGDVRWALEYAWANIGDTMPSSTTVVTTEAADGTALKHQIHDLATITGTGKTLSSMLVCALTRRSSTDILDTFTGIGS